MPHQIDETMRDCIEECQVCFALCTETTQHCLEMGGAHAERTHIRTLIDCAEACQSAAAFMLRSSPLHASTCGVCADACDACAEECERLAGDDDVMTRCAEMCRQCAESCRTMSQQAA